MDTLDPYDFIAENIDSVPHLEALILLWNSRPVGWTAEELSSRLYIHPEQVSLVMLDLVRLEIARELSGTPIRYTYFQRSDKWDDFMHRIDSAYRRDLVRISTLIHSKASSPVREFARAFRIRKESNQ